MGLYVNCVNRSETNECGGRAIPISAVWMRLKRSFMGFFNAYFFLLFVIPSTELLHSHKTCLILMVVNAVHVMVAVGVLLENKYI